MLFLSFFEKIEIRSSILFSTGVPDKAHDRFLSSVLHANEVLEFLFLILWASSNMIKESFNVFSIK